MTGLVEKHRRLRIVMVLMGVCLVRAREERDPQAYFLWLELAAFLGRVGKAVLA